MSSYYLIIASSTNTHCYIVQNGDDVIMSSSDATVRSSDSRVRSRDKRVLSHDVNDVMMM